MSLITVLSTIWTENDGIDRFKYLIKGSVWQVRKRLGQQFVTKLPNNARLKIYPASAYSGIFYSKWPEKKDLLFFRRNAFLGQCFVDVGANVGAFSAYLFDLFDKFILFEPAPSSFKSLVESCDLNSSVNSEVFNIGIGNEKGELAFIDEGDFSTTSRFMNTKEASSNKRVRKIPVDTLDNILSGTTDKLVVKIDVEGFEEKVFLGATKLLKEHRIRLLMFERLGRTNLDNIRSILKKYGYTVFYVSPDGSISFDEVLISKPLINLFAAPDNVMPMLGK